MAKVDYTDLIANAEAAGIAALTGATPTPMVIGQAIGLSDKLDTSKPFWIEDEGACGFAWVHFAGNTEFGRWMKKAGKARGDYPKGLCVWVHEGGQSVERKEAYAHAYAGVLKAAGIDCYPNSRLD